MSTNRRIDPAIIAALIGVMGTVCVSVITLYFTNYGPRPPQPTVPVQPIWTVSPTATITSTPVPTDTVPAGDPSSTPAPDTPTPEPSLTPLPPAIGADWVNNCISVLWRPYPEFAQPTMGNGCLSSPILFPEQVNLFYLENGSLKFNVNRTFETTQVFGLFAPLPANGTVRIDTFLRRVQGGDIWMGIFAEPNMTSQGLVAALPAGENVRNRALVQKKMPEQVEIARMENFAEDPTQAPPRYTVVFELSNGEVRLQKVGDAKFPTVALNAAQPWLFVGYQVVSGNSRIEAEFLNLLVQGQ